MDAELKREFDRLNQKLTMLLQAVKQPKQTWVRAKIIIRLTGWTANEMRQARENGYIQFKEEDGLWYDLSSLNKLFVKNKASLETA